MTITWVIPGDGHFETGLIRFDHIYPFLTCSNPVECQIEQSFVWYFSVRKKWISWNLKIWNKIKIFTFGVTAGYRGRMVRRKWKRKLERGNTYIAYQSYNIRVTLVWFKDLVQIKLDVPVFELPLDTSQDPGSMYKHVFSM